MILPEANQEVEKILLQGILKIVMGVTGGGKSTWISHQNGAKLIGEKEDATYVIENEDQNDEIHPDIGNNNSSCTSKPKLCGQYIDSPGFEDSNGSIVEIINSYSNARMFRKGKKVKLIFVVEFASLLSGRGKDLTDAADRLA